MMRVGDSVIRPDGTTRVRAVVLVSATGPGFVAPSTTEATRRAGMRVPAVVHVTETVIDDPDEAEGLNVQPVAVPRLAKSLEVMPKVVSPNVSEKVADKLPDV